MVQSRRPPPPDSPAREARRLEILRQAAGVFREKGFHGAGMREIAAGLGLRAGAIYHYFPSKMDLLDACQEASLDRLLAGARALAGGDVPAPDRLRRLVGHHLEVILDVLGGSAIHLGFDALPRTRRRRLQARRDAYEAIFRQVVEGGIADGSFRQRDAKAVVLALLGALNGTVVWWRAEGRWSAQAVADEYADLFLRGLEATGGEER